MIEVDIAFAEEVVFSPVIIVDSNSHDTVVGIELKSIVPLRAFSSSAVSFGSLFLRTDHDDAIRILK